MIPYFEYISFENPKALWLLVLLPFIAAWQIWQRRRIFPRIRISNADLFRDVKKSLRQRLFPLLAILRLLLIAVVIVALARPQSSLRGREENMEGVDIVLAIDVSGSMLAEDFSPNRLEAAKNVAADFIMQRPSDRMSLVVFSGESFTQCPLTTDHRILLSQLANVKSGMIQDGTAIGDGLATAVNRVRNSEAKSKTIILLTDGVHNAGSVDPLTAAEIAKMYNIRVYTIGVGTQGVAPYPVQTPFGKQYQNVKVEIDEKLLREMSNMTDGQYFRATNKKKLEAIFKEIDKLEKTKIEVLSFEEKSDEYKPLLWFALALLLLELCLRWTIFRTFP